MTVNPLVAAPGGRAGFDRGRRFDDGWDDRVDVPGVAAYLSAIVSRHLPQPLL